MYHYVFGVATVLGVAEAHYNRQVSLPHPSSTESLWVESHVYDIIVVIEFNTKRVVSGAGSAIFLHIASDDFGPTAGCVALRKQDLQAVLRQCSADTKIVIRNGQASRDAQPESLGSATSGAAL
eukprot:COSAG02_NODE_4915_length_4837_cov_6.226467_3_plen_124_part_00